MTKGWGNSLHVFCLEKTKTKNKGVGAVNVTQDSLIIMVFCLHWGVFCL